MSDEHQEILDWVNELKEDAYRWRALMDCERIRVIGFARGGSEGQDGSIQHISVEFWDRFHEDTGETPCRFVEFVDDLAAAFTAEQADSSIEP